MLHVIASFKNSLSTSKSYKDKSLINGEKIKIKIRIWQRSGRKKTICSTQKIIQRDCTWLCNGTEKSEDGSHCFFRYRGRLEWRREKWYLYDILKNKIFFSLSHKAFLNFFPIQNSRFKSLLCICLYFPQKFLRRYM